MQEVKTLQQSDHQSSLITDRLAAYYETVTKHNLNYRRYYHQFDY